MTVTESKSRRVKRPVIALLAAAILATSALTASPAFADTTLSGQVLDAGVPVANAEVDILKFDTIDRDWHYVTSAPTAVDGTWAKTAALADGTYSLYFYLGGTTSVYSANQGFNAELDIDQISALFTITSGVASSTSFAKTLERNAGILQVTFQNEAGAPITGNAAEGFGTVFLSDRYSDENGFSGNLAALSEVPPAFDGVVTIAHVAAGTYYSGFLDAGDGAGNQFETHDLSPTTIVSSTTNAFTYRLVQSPAPAVADPHPTIAGTAKIGALLTAQTNPAGSALTYQWYTGRFPIVGATSQTFALTTKQLGQPVSVRVFANQAGFANNHFDSADSKPVAIGDPDAATAAISGSTRFGGILKANVTSPLGGTVAYQWYRNGAVIAGADGSSLSISKTEIGTSIFVSVKSTAQGHSDAVVPSAAFSIAKESVSLKATTDKTIKTKTTPKVKITVKPSKSGIGATAKVRVYYTKTRFKSVSVKSGKAATVKLPKLKKGATTLKVVYPGTAYYAAKTVSIKVKVSK